VTVATGLIASTWGPFADGLFLARPAVLPASLTPIEPDEGEAAAGLGGWGAALGARGRDDRQGEHADAAERWPGRLSLTARWRPGRSSRSGRGSGSAG
jgi:hypothetical protein